MKQISASIEGLFVAEDWHNFGADYDGTLIAWFRNFDASWDKLRKNMMKILSHVEILFAELCCPVQNPAFAGLANRSVQEWGPWWIPPYSLRYFAIYQPAFAGLLRSYEEFSR
jgi:hypothetical protein